MLVEISQRTLERINEFDKMDASALSVEEINELKRVARFTCLSLSNDIKHAERLTAIGARYAQEQADTARTLEAGE